MKKNILTGCMLALIIIFGSLFAKPLVQNLPEIKSTAQSISKEKTPCENLDEFLKKEYRNTGKTEDNVRIIGLQEKDALPKALEVCAKLKAKQVSSSSDKLIFQLPGELGYIIVCQVYEDSLYIRLILDTGCGSLPFTELRFISLKDYNRK